MYGLPRGAGGAQKAETFTVMQCNLRRSEAAYELLPQISTEYGADLLMISEQHRNRRTPTWYSNASNTSAIWVRGGSAARVQGSGRGDDFVWATIGNVTHVSVYLSPNKRGQAFLQMVERLEDALRFFNGNLVIAGDFNSRVIEWGMPETNTKGRLLLENGCEAGVNSRELWTNNDVQEAQFRVIHSRRYLCYGQTRDMRSAMASDRGLYSL